MNGSEVPLIRAIRGPVTLITVGVLFALNNFTPYRFNQTWPVILIVFGLLSLLSRGAGPATRDQLVRPGIPPYGFPPPETPSSTYRQSTYTVTDSSSGPAKGGFGTSAPPRTNDPGPTPPPGDSV